MDWCTRSYEGPGVGISGRAHGDGSGCPNSWKNDRKVYHRKWLITAGAKVCAGKGQVVREEGSAGADCRGP